MWRLVIISLCCLSSLVFGEETKKYHIKEYTIELPQTWEKIPVEEACGMFLFKKNSDESSSSYVSGFLNQSHASLSNWWEVITNQDIFSQVGVVRLEEFDAKNESDWDELIHHLQVKKNVQIIDQGLATSRKLHTCTFIKKEEWSTVSAIYFLFPSIGNRAYLLECYSYGSRNEFEAKKPQFLSIAEHFNVNHPIIKKTRQ